MRYAIGDTVVHWTHGLGTVVAIDEMNLAGTTQPYYVVEVEQLKLWVPLDEAQDSSIRLPVEGDQFGALFEILQTRGQPLPSNYEQRKNALRKRMQKRTIEDLCHVIRDLFDHSLRHKINENDAAVLFRAQEHLLDEWVVSLGTDRSEALLSLEALLQENQPEEKMQKDTYFSRGGLQHI